MMKLPKPRVVVSACLMGELCRYDAQVTSLPALDALAERFELIPVCPEVAIGMGVPRSRIDLIYRDGVLYVEVESTGEDVAPKLREYSARFLREVGEVSAFVLKSKSPSCGVRSTKVYEGDKDNLVHREGTGIFAQAVMDALPDVPIYNEKIVDSLKYGVNK